MVSTAFAALAQVTAQSIGHDDLPFVVVPHPVGDRDSEVIKQRGAAVVDACAHALITSAEVLAHEVSEHPFSLPDAVMPR